MEWLLDALALYLAVGGLIAFCAGLARVRYGLDFKIFVLVVMVLVWPLLFWLVAKSDARKAADAAAKDGRP